MVAEQPLGVYSALRTFDHNKFLGLDGHLARNRQAMSLLGWDYALDEAALRRALHTAVTNYHHPDALVRFDVLAKPITVAGTETRVLISLLPFYGRPAKYYRDGVRVGFAEALHRDNPLAKTAVYAQQRQAFPIGSDEVYERLLLDDQQRILECTSANFYAMRDGVVYTAAAGILEGITRKIILDLIQELAIPLVLEPFPLAEIHTLEEAALSSSSRAIIPIVQIGEQVVGNGRPGPIAQQLLTAYNAYVADAVKTAVG
jgi:branched-chain amino acid aminotransferase